jgi:hypothetical protein
MARILKQRVQNTPIPPPNAYHFLLTLFLAMSGNLRLYVLIFVASVRLLGATELSQPLLNFPTLLDGENEQIVDEQTGPLVIDGETDVDGLNVESSTR